MIFLLLNVFLFIYDSRPQDDGACHKFKSKLEKTPSSLSVIVTPRQCGSSLSAGAVVGIGKKLCHACMCVRVGVVRVHMIIISP